MNTYLLAQYLRRGDRMERAKTQSLAPVALYCGVRRGADRLPSPVLPSHHPYFLERFSA